MFDKTYPKRLLVCMAMMDMMFVALDNLKALDCNRPPLWCKLLRLCILVINIACLVCVYVGFKKGNSRLFTPYAIYVLIRVVYVCVAFLIVLTSLNSPTPEFFCDACECECPTISNISPEDILSESAMQYALRIALVLLFIQLCWDILTLTLIRMSVPDAMRFTRRREPPPTYEYQNPQYQAPV